MDLQSALWLQKGSQTQWLLGLYPPWVHQPVKMTQRVTKASPPPRVAGERVPAGGRVPRSGAQGTISHTGAKQERVHKGEKFCRHLSI